MFRFTYRSSSVLYGMIRSGNSTFILFQLVHIEFSECLCCMSAASDLDSIRALFNEKEKELSLAVAKVEELTHQLEELKRGRGTSARDQQQQTASPAALELDKLRRELMVWLAAYLLVSFRF